MRRTDFGALVERGRTGTSAAATTPNPQAQAFWEDDYLPTPIITLDE